MRFFFHYINKHSNYISNYVHKFKDRYTLSNLGTFVIVKLFCLIIGFFGLIYLHGIFAQTPPNCNNIRNNDMFINEIFWELNPTDDDIVCALYGTTGDINTAYTTTWTGYTSGSCLSDMTVLYTGSIPEIMTDNTIYVIESGSYNISTGTSMANCSAIISSGNVVLNKTGALNMIYSDTKNNTILDNIYLNGSGLAGNGIYITLSENSTIHNVESYNNSIGMALNSASYVTINNSISHNNTHGIYIYGSVNNIITGSKTNNNSQHGIYIQSSQYTMINNIETHNNNMGIYFASASYNKGNKIHSYNNIWGMYLYASSRNTLDNSNYYNNKDGLGSYRYANYNTFNNINVYNNTRIGTLISDGSQYNNYNNMNIYNNGREGLLIWSENNTRHNTFNNIHTYNNLQGIVMEGGSTYNSFNNVLSHNNTIGLLLINYKNRTISNNIYNTIQIYNNTIGLETQGGAKTNIYNNIQIYNNTTGTNMHTGDTGNIYYGEMTVFGNGDGNILGNGNNFITGYGSTNPLITRNTGEMFLTGKLSWDLFTNAISTSENYLLPRNSTRGDIKGKQTLYTGDVTEVNSYGSGILRQGQPVIWSGIDDLVTGGTFDITKYIGSNTVKSSGTISGLNIFSKKNSRVYGYSDDPNNSYYSLFGDIHEAQTGIILNTVQDILLISGDGEKRIITQLFGDNIFATHFQKTTLLDETPPNQTTLILPISGSIHTSSNIHLSWDIAIDTGVGMSGYIFEITHNNVSILSGTTINTGINVLLAINENYERKVYAIDVLGNISLASETGNFSINSDSTEIIGDTGGGSGGGGGGATLYKDDCPGGDCSPSYYDDTCDEPHSSAEEKFGDTTDSPFSEELNQAYQRAYNYGITTMPSIQKANVKGTLIRKDMAKMITEFAVNVLKKDISSGVVCEFADTKGLSKEMQSHVIASCKLGLMGLENDGLTPKKNFDPNQKVTRAQFGTILSRLLRVNKYDNGKPYYTNHLTALKTEGIMTKIENHSMLELRGRVIVMLKRVFER